jgi:RimJ/RimL family protein N-acetyltransferase
MVPYDRPVTELRDELLVLRPMQVADPDALVAGLNDPDVGRFMPLVPVPYTRAAADAWIERCAGVWETGESFPFAILDAETEELLGSIELHGGGSTVGYWVRADVRGRGIATRAVRLVCEWATQRPLQLMTHPDNLASRRVAEKAGFRRIGTTRDHPAFSDGTREAVLFELA